MKNDAPTNRRQELMKLVEELSREIDLTIQQNDVSLKQIQEQLNTICAGYGKVTMTTVTHQLIKSFLEIFPIHDPYEYFSYKLGHVWWRIRFHETFRRWLKYRAELYQNKIEIMEDLLMAEAEGKDKLGKRLVPEAISLCTTSLGPGIMAEFIQDTFKPCRRNDLIDEIVDCHPDIFEVRQDDVKLLARRLGEVEGLCWLISHIKNAFYIQYTSFEYREMIFTYAELSNVSFL